MTCIVGIIHENDVYMGGDSAGVAEYSLTIRADEKIFINGPFVIGFTDSFRMGQLLRYKFVPPKQTARSDDMKYIVTDFIDSVKKCFVDNGFGTSSQGGTFLVAYNKKLYHIYSDFQVGVSKINYDACGGGSDLALGALYATPAETPTNRIKIALKAAAQFNGGVLAPFKVIKLPISAGR